MFREETLVNAQELSSSLLGASATHDPSAASGFDGWIVHVSSDDEAFGLASHLAGQFRAAGGAALVASWRESFVRPFGGLLDVVEELAAWAQPRQPELLQRFGWSLVNLLYPWRKTEAALPSGELRAGLADLVLRGDQRLVHQFFQKRNVRPQIVSYLSHFLLETGAAIAAATSAPVLLCLGNAHLADDISVSALKLLNRYARAKRIPVRICLIAEEAPGSALDALLASDDLGKEWQAARLGDGETLPTSRRVYERLSPERREVLEAAAVFALPFTQDDWAAVLPAELRAAAEASVQALVDEGVLRRVGEDRLRFAHVGLLKAVEEGADAEKLAALHALARERAESADAFAAALHATEGRCDASLRRYCLQAMERAWAVSAYECALIFAERALAATADDSDLDGNLLLAMLNYEAERYEDAHRLLVASLEHPTNRLEPKFIEYLIGYNAVFGTGNFKLGIETLGNVLEYYEEKGDKRGAAYIRNSLAFAHFCSRNVDEAIRLEELNIEQLRSAQVSDSFLVSILQLNLGRLYRNTGDAERALKLIQRGLNVPQSELSSHALLLFYATLGGFKFSKGDYRGALSAYHRSFELVRNVQLDSVKDQVLLALSRGAPALPEERTTRADELLYYLHFHLGMTCCRLGLDSRAAVYLDSMRRQSDLLGEDVVGAVEAAFRAEWAAPDTKPSLGDEGAEGFEQAVQNALSRLPDLAREADAGGDRIAWVVNALKVGQVVAILRPRNIGDGVQVVDSQVLYDPRRQELAERMKFEIGGSHILRATAALVLPESAGLFADLARLPLSQQAATLKPEHRAEFPALIPIRICVQMLSPDFDGYLHDVLRGFASETGVGMLAVAPFHLWRRDLATTPRDGLLHFLVSSIDAFALGDRLLFKAHGSTGVENLLNFRPRLSEEAFVYSGANDSILVRIKRRGGYATDDLLKLHSGTRPILDLCDGSLSVADVMGRMSGPLGRQDERICAFLRDLWRRGALCFDEPAGANGSANRTTAQGV